MRIPLPYGPHGGRTPGDPLAVPVPMAGVDGVKEPGGPRRNMVGAATHRHREEIVPMGRVTAVVSLLPQFRGHGP